LCYDPLLTTARLASGTPVSWPLDLDGVTTNRLADDGHWPGPGKLKLNGFKYNAFSGDHPSTFVDRRRG
jgi:hypothetical protein